MSQVPAVHSDLARLEELLDTAEVERKRLNRRIRRIRNMIEAVKNGDPLEDLEELFGQPLSAAVSAPPPEPVASPGRPFLVHPGQVAQPQIQLPPGSASPEFATRLGMGLAPNVPSPVPPPPSMGEFQMPSVDVGRIGRMTPDQLDALPFGVVTLDHTGRVIGYNDTESRMAGVPKERVIGRNFFTDVAPCSRVRDFEGRFRTFASGGSRLGLETFEFVFHFSHGAQRVVIMVSPARYRGQFHVSMIRR